MAFEHGGGVGHGVDVELDEDAPHPAAIERRRRPAIEDAVEVATAGGREARMEVRSTASVFSTTMGLGFR